jgi:hypothetical protein
MKTKSSVHIKKNGSIRMTGKIANDCLNSLSAQAPSPGFQARLKTPLGDSLIQLHIRVIDMQLKHFPQSTVQSLLKHLRKEVDEVMKNPQDDSEWADLVILLLGAAWRAQRTPWDLMHYAHEKMHINETREWPSEPDADGIYHHKTKNSTP